MVTVERLNELWNELYSDVKTVNQDLARSQFDDFINRLNDIKKKHFMGTSDIKKDWYKDAVVYSAYVDLFNKNFRGLREKLDYLQELGVNCLWLLPFLDSCLCFISGD